MQVESILICRASPMDSGPGKGSFVSGGGASSSSSDDTDEPRQPVLARRKKKNNTRPPMTYRVDPEESVLVGLAQQAQVSESQSLLPVDYFETPGPVECTQVGPDEQGLNPEDMQKLMCLLGNPNACRPPPSEDEDDDDDEEYDEEEDEAAEYAEDSDEFPGPDPPESGRREGEAAGRTLEPNLEGNARKDKITNDLDKLES